MWVWYIWSRFAGRQPPPMVWVPRTKPLDPDSPAICSSSELQHPIWMPSAPLRSTNFSTYMDYLHYSLETNIYIYIYMTKNNTHIHRGEGGWRWAPRTMTMGGGEGEPRNLDHVYLYIYIHMSGCFFLLITAAIVQSTICVDMIVFFWLGYCGLNTWYWVNLG